MTQAGTRGERGDEEDPSRVRGERLGASQLYFTAPTRDASDATPHHTGSNLAAAGAPVVHRVHASPGAGRGECARRTGTAVATGLAHARTRTRMRIGKAQRGNGPRRYRARRRGSTDVEEDDKDAQLGLGQTRSPDVGIERAAVPSTLRHSAVSFASASSVHDGHGAPSLQTDDDDAAFDAGTQPWYL